MLIFFKCSYFDLMVQRQLLGETIDSSILPSLNKKRQAQTGGKAQYRGEKVVKKIFLKPFPQFTAAHVIALEQRRVEVLIGEYGYTDWVGLSDLIPPFEYEVRHLLADQLK